MNLKKFNENVNDNDVLRKCRRDAFIKDAMRKPLKFGKQGKRF